MKYVKRFIWLLGFTLVIMFGAIVFILIMILYPAIIAIYYVKDGNLSNTNNVLEILEYIYEKYSELRPD